MVTKDELALVAKEYEEFRILVEVKTPLLLEERRTGELLSMQNKLKILKDVYTTTSKIKITKDEPRNVKTSRAIAIEPYIQKSIKLTAKIDRFGLNVNHTGGQTVCLHNVKTADTNIGILEHSWSEADDLLKRKPKHGDTITFIGMFQYRRRPSESIYEKPTLDAKLHILEVLSLT